MSAIAASERRLSATLLVLRLLVFGVLSFWACDKIFNAAQAARIFDVYFSLGLPPGIVSLIGFAELALLVAFLVGYRKRFVRGVLLALMGIACIAPARFYLTPFDDHILLYFARFPALAVIFMLYRLRDRDTWWSLGADRHQTVGRDEPSRADEPVPGLALCLALIRFAVFFDLLMWNMDKFFHPLQTSRIFRAFYNVGAGLPGTEQLSYAAVYLLGTLQLVLIVAFVAGVRKRFTYGLVFALHTVSTFAPWERFLDPLTSHTLLFLVSFPMLGGIGALYYLREQDRLWTWPPGRAARRSMRAALAPPRVSMPARVVLAAFTVAGAYVVIGSAVQWRTQVDTGPVLVAELRARTEPSAALQALEPAWDTAEWTATYHSANCTFDHPDIDDCWEIHFIVWVPGLPGQRVMEGERQVEAAWIVDGRRLDFEPNRDALGLFELAEGYRYSRG